MSWGKIDMNFEISGQKAYQNPSSECTKHSEVTVSLACVIEVLCILKEAWGHNHSDSGLNDTKVSRKHPATNTPTLS